MPGRTTLLTPLWPTSVASSRIWGPFAQVLDTYHTYPVQANFRQRQSTFASQTNVLLGHGGKPVGVVRTYRLEAVAIHV
jgi:hypothetical protein